MLLSTHHVFKILILKLYSVHESYKLESKLTIDSEIMKLSIHMDMKCSETKSAQGGVNLNKI